MKLQGTFSGFSKILSDKVYMTKDRVEERFVLKLDATITFTPLKEQQSLGERREIAELREGHEEEGNEN